VGRVVARREMKVRAISGAGTFSGMERIRGMG